MATEFEAISDGVTIAGEEAGEGVPVVLLHGLTATRRYVVMGSKLLERSGHRVVQYDARAHGRSSPAPDAEAYNYDLLGNDAIAVMDELGIERAVLAGASMGAHTLLNMTLRHPERVAGIVVITPAYSGDMSTETRRLARWDVLSEALRTGGVEGFVAAYGIPQVSSPEIAKTIVTVTRQRLSLHEHPDALADCLHQLPRSSPFKSLSELATIDVPAAIVASNDDADPEHPEALGILYATTIPGAQLVRDEPGRSPVAWQGSQLSQVIAGVAAAADLGR